MRAQVLRVGKPASQEETRPDQSPEEKWAAPQGTRVTPTANVSAVGIPSGQLPCPLGCSGTSRSGDQVRASAHGLTARDLSL